jgi:BASS family bile acid:Na+ symporter
MKPGMLRTFALLGAMIAGALAPQAAAAAFAVRWLIVAMLFLVFLQVRFTRETLRPSHGVLLLANIALAFAGWGLGWIAGGRELALAGFFAGIGPTATAAAVVVRFLRGRPEYVVTAFLVNTLGVALLLPLALPLLLGHPTPNVFAQVAGSVGLVVFLPLAFARLVCLLYPAAQTWPGRLAGLSFGMWVIALFLIVAKASHYIRAQVDVPPGMFVLIAAIVAVVCGASFSLGRLVGGREYGMEASQALGQKNTILTIYLAMVYASPVVALGPTCYVVWHNLWNTWQLHRQARAEAGE